MIKVKPTNNNNKDMYEIIWEPVKNVNHGLISYTVKVLEKEDRKLDYLVSFLSINYNNGNNKI